MHSPLLAADQPRQGLALALLAQWPLWLPVVFGAAAIYFLLPRPRAYPWFWGLVVGVVGLLLGGLWLVQTGRVWQETLSFYVFSALAVTGGALLITQQAPARAALSFTLVILASSGLFLLLAAPFLMAATIIVYAGAIVVTFLFVIMLAHQEGRTDADARSREPLLATLTGFVLLATLLYVIKNGDVDFDRRLADVKRELAAAKKPDDEQSVAIHLLNELGDRYKDDRGELESLTVLPPDEQNKKLAEILDRSRSRYNNQDRTERLTALRPAPSLALSDASGPAANTLPEEIRRDEIDGQKTAVPALPAENAAYLGKSLFTDYLLPVELAGFLLLVATVGAVAIGQRRDKTKPDALVNGPPATGGSA